MPKTTIIIPTYKRAALLERALESLASQTCSDFEALVIENGASAEALAVVESFQRRGLPVQYLYTPEACSVSARNLGIKRAEGEYIAFFDDDDEWLPEKLERQIAFLEAHPKYGLTASQGILIDEKGQERTEVPDLSGDFFYRTLVERGSIILGMSTVLVRRAVFDEIGLMKPEHILHDYDLYLRIAKKFPCYLMKEPLIRYYRHSGNMSNNIFKLSEDMIVLLKQIRPARETGVTEEMIQASIARNSRQIYALADSALGRKQFKLAAHYFFTALYHDPVVGVRLSWSRFSNPVYQFFRPYVWLGYSFLRSLAEKKSLSEAAGK